MRVNIYAEETTQEVEVTTTLSPTGNEFMGIRFILESSDKLHHRPAQLPSGVQGAENKGFNSMPLSPPLEKPSGSWKHGRKTILCGLCGSKCGSWQECVRKQKSYNPSSYEMMSPAWNDIDHDRLNELVENKIKELMEKYPQLTRGDCAEWIALVGGKDVSTRIVDTSGGAGHMSRFLYRHHLPLASFGKDYKIPLLTDKLPKKKANKKNVAKPKLLP